MSGEARGAMQYYEPNFIDEALVLLERFGTNAQVLAGGTRLRFALRRQSSDDAALINLKRITELSRIELAPGELRIGPLVTAAMLGRHPLIAEHAPLIARAALSLGAPQLQTVATIGGNVVSADPAADLVPALVAYDASADIAITGEPPRTASVEEIVSKQPSLERGQLLTLIRLPVGAHRAAYQKMTTRQGLEMAVVSVAAWCRLEGEIVGDARIAIAGAAPSVFRAKNAEKALAGERLSVATARAAGHKAAEESKPATDSRASAEYRRALVAALAERAVLELS